MLDGAADGTPPLRSKAEYREWIAICSREYLRLQKDAEKVRQSFLAAYGATNEAEFFAVATEQFFNQPLIVAPDEAHSQKESRFYALGQTDMARLLFVVFTVRKTLIRIISARDMSRAEKEVFKNHEE